MDLGRGVWDRVLSFPWFCEGYGSFSVCLYNVNLA